MANLQWATLEIVLHILLVTFGFVEMIDVQLARTLFSWTLRPIGYFWLFPA